MFESFGTIGIRVVIIWENDLDLSHARIKSRGHAHRTIGPNDNALLILRRTIKDYVPLSEEEIISYNVTKVILVDTKMNRYDVIRTVLNDLQTIDSLEYLHLSNILSKDIKTAIRLSSKREVQIIQENKSKLVEVSPQMAVQEGRYELLVHHNRELLLETFSAFNTNSHFVVKQHFHVTLLFINRKLASELNGAPNTAGSGIDPLMSYHTAIDMYKHLTRQNVVVRPIYVAKNERVMAVKVEFSHHHSDIKYFDVVPHISIAKLPAAEFREANYLIEACDELRSRNCTDPTGMLQWEDFHVRETLTGSIHFKMHGQH